MARRAQGVVLAAGAVLAALVPLAAARHLDRRLERGVAPALGAGLGATVSIGDAEAGLTGSFALRDVRVGGLLRAEAIAVGASLGSLLAGRLRADEIQIVRPALAVHADGRGYSNLERVVSHAARRRRLRRGGRAGSKATAPRRIVVRGGDLVVDLGTRGHAQVSGVELRPRAGGVRVVTGRVSLSLAHGKSRVEGHFERAAADLGLADGFDLRRFLADGGQLSVGAGEAPVTLSRAVVSGGRGDVSLELLASVGDGGSLRATLSEPLAPRTLRVALDRAPLALATPLLPGWIGTRDAVLSGRASWRPGDGRVELDLAVDRLSLSHPRLATLPVEVAGRVHGTGHVRRAAGRLAVALDRVLFESGALAIEVEGSAEWTAGATPERAALDLRLAPVECNAALSSLPAVVRAPLVGLAARGRLAGSVHVELARDDAALTRLESRLDLDGCEVVSEAAAADPRAFARGGEALLPDGRRRVFDGSDPGFVALSDLPAHVAGAFVSSEDARFFRHDGFDHHQIERSLALDVSEGRLLRGGSTITQQLAKNLFLRRDRTLVRKLQEAVLAWRLERVLSKERILELYLSYIELSDRDDYGLVEASRRWFGLEPGRLSARQAAFLAALTSEPTTMSARLRAAGGVDEVSAHRVDLVLRAMKRDGVLSAAAHARAGRERLRLAPGALRDR